MATVIRDPMDLLTSVDMVNTGGSAYKDSDKRVLASWPADANAPQLSTGGAGHTTFAAGTDQQRAIFMSFHRPE